MSGTARRRGSRGRLLRSEPSPTEDPEDLKDEEKEKEDGKRPVTGGAGDTPAFPPPPESFTLSTGINAQLQAQLARISRLKK
jgi:hypothetical protein